MNTPTPRTDVAWSCFSGYTEPLQNVKDLSHELERELNEARKQRDRLAEALRKFVGDALFCSHADTATDVTAQQQVDDSGDAPTMP